MDFAENTVQSVRSRFPELPVSKGNVLNLELGDQSLDAYISLGIVEHFQKGPQKAISEAFRVLKKNGILSRRIVGERTRDCFAASTSEMSRCRDRRSQKIN